jgi:hypothetical protein
LVRAAATRVSSSTREDRAGNVDVVIDRQYSADRERRPGNYRQSVSKIGARATSIIFAMWTKNIVKDIDLTV